MKFAKKKRLWVFSILMIVLNIENSYSMVMASPEEHEFSVKWPLSEWPKVSEIERDPGLSIYNMLWNEKDSLEANQTALLNKFISTCCDFSFHTVSVNIGGIRLGKVQRGKCFVFVDKNVKLRIRSNSNKAWLYDENNKNQSLKVPLTTRVFIGINPVDFTDRIKQRLMGYLKKIVEDPVGCELFRRAIVKYELGRGSIDRIKFIPAEREGLDLAFTSGKDVNQYLGRMAPLNNSYDFRGGRKFIMFSPNLDDNNPNRVGLKVKLREGGRRTFWDKFQIEKCNYPVDSGLFYQIVYALNGDSSNLSTKVIEDRSDNNIFSFNLNGFGLVSVPNKQLYVSIFSNDAVYRAMYGLTPVGLNLLNESSYLAHRYNYLRPAYVGVKTKLKIKGQDINSEEMFDFVQRFLKFNADSDLYEYYLSPDSPIVYPEFGEGAYKHSGR